MSHPAIIAARFLYGLLAPAGAVEAGLAAAGVLGVWPDAIPEDQHWSAGASPRYHVIYAAESQGVDGETVGRVRQINNPRYVVKVVGRVSDIGLLDAAAARIDALLQASGVTHVAGGVVDACDREAPLRLGPLLGPGGVRTYQLGGLYRLYMREE